VSTWEWRQNVRLPKKALVVATRAEYTPEGWEALTSVATPAYARFLANPHVLGLALYHDEKNLVSWGLIAWSSYDALEQFIDEEMEWAAQQVEKYNLNSGVIRRHNAYRIMKTRDLPLTWEQVAEMVAEVMRVSPLGADAFSELTKRWNLRPTGDQ
jgi:hypothetical protein